MSLAKNINILDSTGLSVNQWPDIVICYQYDFHLLIWLSYFVLDPIFFPIYNFPGPLGLTWINFYPSMDK